MKRHTVLAQLVVFGAISVLVIGYAVFGLLKVRITSRPFPVTVQLQSAGGIFEGAEVAYRGVRVGKVSSLDLHTDGVTIKLSIDSGTKVPANAIAHIYDLSAVGEQYVDLEPPPAPSTDYLHGGSVIPRERTTTPLETATVLYDLEQFVDSINPNDLQIIGREGALAFQGTGPELKSILNDTVDIVDQLSSSEDAMLRLVHNSSILLRGAANHSDAFDHFSASLKALTTTLAAKTPTIDKFLRQGEPTTRLVNSIITDNGSALTTLLGNLASLSQIQAARIPGLRSVLLAIPAFGRLAPSVIHDGTLLGVADANQDQRLCETGVPLTSPISGKKTPLYSVSCGSDIVRGAANVPQPSSGTSTDSGSQVEIYDARNGLVSDGAGDLVRLGTNGGQEELFGRNSWQALLLAGTGS